MVAPADGRADVERLADDLGIDSFDDCAEDERADVLPTEGVADADGNLILLEVAVGDARDVGELLCELLRLFAWVFPVERGEHHALAAEAVHTAAGRNLARDVKAATLRVGMLNDLQMRLDFGIH